MLLILKTVHFQLKIIHKSDLRISYAGKHSEIIRIKHF